MSTSKCQHCLENVLGSFLFCPYCGAKQMTRAIGYGPFEPPERVPMRVEDPDEDWTPPEAA